MKRFTQKGTLLYKAIAIFVLVSMLTGMFPAYAFADSSVDISAEATAQHVSQVASLAQYLKNSATFGTRNGGFPWDSEGKSRSWTYYNGLMMDAFMMLDPDGYYSKVNEYYNANISSQGKVDSTGNSDNYYRTNELDSIAPTRALFDLIRLPDSQISSTAKQKYKKMIDYVYSVMLTYETVASAGNNFKHKVNSSSWTTYPIALDGLYMAQPFFMEIAKALEEGVLTSSDFNTYSKTTVSPATIYSNVVQRMTWVADNLYNSGNNLYNHGWGPSAGVNGQYWLRAVGWYAAALADVISLMPDSYSSQRQTLIAKETRLFDGMIGYQDSATGMWNNVINRGTDLVYNSNSNKAETSGSALIAYAMMKSYTEGFIDKSYGEAGLQAFNGTVENNLTVSRATVTLHNTYRSSGVETTPEGYLRNTYNDNEAKGVGPTIMASTYADDAVNKLAADNVTEKIADIGAVAYTNACKNRIDDARDAYDALTAAQKAMVTNYAVLTAAEAEYAELEAAASQSSADQAAADSAMAKIAAIGSVDYTDVCKAKIDDARDTYNALTAAQKALVTNYSVLTAAETEYAALQAAAEQSETDQAAADAVIAKIAAIGTVTDTAECKAKIDDARDAYTALTAAQRALVTNYSVLTAAETRYAELHENQQTDPDVPEGYHKAISTEVIYELYTPNTNGQIIEPGRYIMLNEALGYVVAGKEAVHGGIAASTHYTVSGDRITAPSSDVMTFVGIESQPNNYYLHNSDGAYVSIYPAANQSAATLNTLPAKLVARLINGKIELCEENGEFALSAYQNNVFGVSSAGGNSVNQNNLFTLYREVRLTTEVLVPDYPAEHSVGLFKEAEPIDFQETGLAKVDISFSAIPPFYSTGVDVLFITDISNSMAWKAGTQRAPVSGETSKLQDMQAAVSAFTDAVMGANEGTGIAGNNTVTFCTFGGWDADRNSNASTHSGSYIDPTRTLITASADPNAVKTAVNNITFNMTDSNTYYLSFDGIKYTDAAHKGYGNTVYDYGFMEGYAAAQNIKASYESETHSSYSDSGRQIFVIFISDGAPTNYNGKMYKNPGGPLADGRYSENNVIPANNESGYSMYDYGNVSDLYDRQPIWFDYISNESHHWATKLFNMDQVAGMDTIGIDFLHGGFQAGKQNDETIYWIFEPGSNMDLGIVLSSLVEGETLNILTADNQEELANSLAEEAKRVSLLASSVSVEDLIGQHYSLQRASYITNPVDGSQVPLSEYSVRPSITISRYPTVHYNAGGSNDHVGEINGDPVVLEQVTFSDDGEMAYSTLINNSQTNIMTDSGVIRAHYFYYNTNDYEVDIDGIVIPPESFSWHMAKLIEDRLMLSYYVRLEGSEDYSAEPGMYPTNENASLTYRSYDGDTITDYFEKPELEWKNEYYITVNKKWTDAVAAHDPITAKVIYEAADGTATDVSEFFILSASNDWTAEVMTDLSHLPENGTYKVVDDADGYYDISGEIKTAIVERDGVKIHTNHLEITLYNTPEVLTSFEVTKTWSDIAVDDHADDPIEVELYCNGVPTGRTAELNAGNQWYAIFNDLQLTVDGAKAVYTAQELTEMEDYISVSGSVVNINAGDVPANAVIIDDGSKTGIIVYEDQQGYAQAVVPQYSQNISNEINSDILHLRIDKKWSGSDGHGPVTLALGFRYANGEVMMLRQNIVLNADNGWSAVINTLNITDAGEYFIEESNIPAGYQVTIGDFDFTSSNSAKVTVYNVSEPKTALTAYKTWADGAANHSGEAVEVELMINGAASGRTAMLNESNGWRYTFGDLDVKDSTGTTYSYSIRENTTSMLFTAAYSAVTTSTGVITVPGYELKIDGGATDVSIYENRAGEVIAAAPSFNQTVTNTPVTVPDTVRLIVNKEWADNLASHPDVTAVIGYEAADGSVTQASNSFTLSADTNWSSDIEVVPCDLTAGRYVLLEPTNDGYVPITGGIETVDSTRTIEAFVPADSLVAGNDYIITDTAANYVIGYRMQSSNSYPLQAYDNSNFTHIVGDASEGNLTHHEYFTSVPDNAVWTYTSANALQSGNRFMDISGVSTFGQSTAPDPIYYSALNGTTFGSYSGKLYTTITSGWAWFSRTSYYYLYNNNGTLSTQSYNGTSNNYGTEFRLFRKTTITVGGQADAITATNIPKLGNQSVIIDYGLPVEVSVAAYLSTLGIDPAFVGIGAPGAQSFEVTDERPAGYDASEAVYPHGAVSYADGKLTYTPTDMTMSEKDVVNLAFSLDVNGTTMYLYGSVTVIPATIMYYEESFVTFTDTANNVWTTETGDNDGFMQNEDRPGAAGDLLAAIDADNVYGFDEANANCTTYSNGLAKRVTVGNGDYAANGKKWPKATFTFTGTAFDLISVTSNNTGLITLDIYQGTDTSGTKYDSWIVDTFYGYDRVRDGFIRHEWYWNGKWYVNNTIVQEVEEIPEDQILPANIQLADTKQTYITYDINYTWTPSSRADSALYQIPVIKSTELPYGTYTVVITPSYGTFFDHTKDPETGKKTGHYDFYLDAIRTYAPAEDYEGYNREYYTKDGEGWPQLIELRKNIISAAEAMTENAHIGGAVFFDSMSSETDDGSDLTDYKSYGPDNEVYLAPGQSISFALQCRNNGKAIDTVQISAKKLTGQTVRLAVSHTAADDTEEDLRTIEIVSASDMYYSVGDNLNWKDDLSDIVTLTNVGQAAISITNVKLTYKEIELIQASLAPMNRMMLKRASRAADSAVVAGKSECFHRYEFAVTTLPTESESGIVTATCVDCGSSFEIAIPALSSGVYEMSGTVSATPEKDGWIEYTWSADDSEAAATFRVVLPAHGEYIWASGDGVDPAEFEAPSGEGNSEAPTEVTSEVPSEPATEPQTEPITEPQTEPITEPQTEAPTEGQDKPDAQKDDGVTSVITKILAFFRNFINLISSLFRK